MAERGSEPDDVLFPTNRGAALSHDALAQRLASYVARCPRLAGRTITPHVLRHTAAMRLLHAGVDITVIALWLGHESVATTPISLRADMELKQRALDRTAPSDTRPGRYKPTDGMLAFLEAL
jgi:site-specific recombinase XerD